MIRSSIAYVWLLSGLILAGPLGATNLRAAASEPYCPILESNIFRLRAPEAVVQPTTPTPPLPQITLAGITTILGEKRVLLKVQFPARPPEPAHEKSYILGEGQQADGIQVLEINPPAGSARVKVSGVEITLSFTKPRFRTA